jgi:SWI/SNF-related matrix-associated actin-dependent regulator 1 of chromatin subfamily A
MSFRKSISAAKTVAHAHANVSLGFYLAMRDASQTIEIRTWRSGLFPRDVWNELLRVRGDGRSLDASMNIEQYTAMLEYIKSIEFVKVEEVPEWVLSCIEARRNDLATSPTQGYSGDLGLKYLTEISRCSLGGIDRASQVLPYQLDGARFGVRRGGRLLIADEMGLGKTLQAIMIAYEYKAEWPVLIVCPSSIRFVWREQLSRWLGGLIDPHSDVQVITKGKEAPRKEAKIVIVPYILLEPNEHLRQRTVDKGPYKVVICDESHYMKDPSSKRSKAVQKILKTAKRIVLLSGTPSMNNAEEMYAQIVHLLPVQKKPTLTEFRERYCVRSEFLVRGYPVVKYGGARNKEELNALLVKAVMIRRMKADVLSQLPEKIRNRIDLDVENSVFAKKVQQMTTSWLSRTTGGPILPSASSEYGIETMELWRLTGQAKLAALKEYLSDLLENADGPKFILFAHHKFVMNGLEDMLLKSLPVGGYIRIDGEVPHPKRAEHVKTFQTDPNCRVALLSITSCSEGITLTAANIVVFCEMYWVPGLIEQAEARAHRVGQKDCVLCYYLVMPHSPDEVIFNMLERKKKDTSRILDGAETGLIPSTPKQSQVFDGPTDDDFADIIDIIDDESKWIPTSATDSQTTVENTERIKRLRI